MTVKINQHLADKNLLPNQHFVDSSYPNANNFLRSHEDYGLKLIAPPLPNKCWQSQANEGFYLSYFTINWQKKQAICPMKETSVSWKKRQDKSGNKTIDIRFDKNICLGCQSRHLCTKSKNNPHLLKISPQKEFDILQKLRLSAQTAEFKKTYSQRAGIEGTISQATRGFSVRRSRYIDLAKTHLQNIAIATAINLTRLVAWFDGIHPEFTRTSRFALLE